MIDKNSEEYKFIYEQERELIEALGEDDFIENKVYFVDEVIEFMKQFSKTKRKINHA